VGPGGANLSKSTHETGCPQFCSEVLLIYDLATTLDIEMVRVWTGKFSLFTVLWTLVSYLCVGLNIAPVPSKLETEPLVETIWGFTASALKR